MVRQMVSRSSQYDIHQRKQFRIRLGPDNVCTWRSRVRKTILGSSLPFPHVAPQRISQKGPFVCVLQNCDTSPTRSSGAGIIHVRSTQQNTRRGLTHKRAGRAQASEAGSRCVMNPVESVQLARYSLAWRSRATCYHGCLQMETNQP